MLQSVLFIARILISMQCNLVCIQTAQKPPTLTWLVSTISVSISLKLQHWKITLLLFIVLSWPSYSKQQKKRVFASWAKNTESIFELKQNKKGEKGHWKNLSKDKLKFCLEILKIKIDPRLCVETKLSQATIQCNPPVHF